MRKNKKTAFRKFYDDDEFYGYLSQDEEAIIGYMSPYSRSAPTAAAATGEGRGPKAQPLKPRNDRQAEYLRMLGDDRYPIVAAIGSAGTGKSFIGASYGIERLQQGMFSKIVLTRPLVTIEEEAIGALPGSLASKMDPWLRNFYDVFKRYVTQAQIDAMIEKGLIEIVPLCMMRGRSFENTYIIADELQNSTQNQMLMLLTRIGENSKLILAGDPDQHDRLYGTNGLADLLYKLKRSPQDGIGVVEFTEQHVERHPIIRKILRLYNKDSKRFSNQQEPTAEPAPESVEDHSSTEQE